MDLYSFYSDPIPIYFKTVCHFHCRRRFFFSLPGYFLSTNGGVGEALNIGALATGGWCSKQFQAINNSHLVKGISHWAMFDTAGLMFEW